MAAGSNPASLELTSFIDTLRQGPRYAGRADMGPRETRLGQRMVSQAQLGPAAVAASTHDFAVASQAAMQEMIAVETAAMFLSERSKAWFEQAMQSNIDANLAALTGSLRYLNAHNVPLRATMLGKTGLVGGVGFNTDEGYYNFFIQFGRTDPVPVPFVEHVQLHA